MAMITTKIGGLVVQMSEEAFEAHQAKLAKDAARRAMIRRLNPMHWLRRWSERQALRRFTRDEAARLGTALQAIDFACDASEEEAGDWYDRLEFLREWRVGADLSEWPAYKPQAPASEARP